MTECLATLEMGDPYEEIIFTCELERHHAEWHRATGVDDGRHFTFEWELTQAELEDPLVPGED